MLSKIRLILTVLVTIAVLLSFWGVPLFVAWIATYYMTALWRRILLYALALLWIILIRPWNMYKGPVFKRFLSDLAVALEYIFFH